MERPLEGYHTAGRLTEGENDKDGGSAVVEEHYTHTLTNTLQ